MKRKLIFVILILALVTACQKEQSDKGATGATNKELTIESIKKWYQPNSAFEVNWAKAEKLTDTAGTCWLVNIKGTPGFEAIRLGYRKLEFYKDQSGKIQERILEIIPDPLYLQRVQVARSTDFTGRVFVYNVHYQLLYGQLLSSGQVIGSIKAAVNDPNANKLQTESNKIALTCTWYENNYVDGDGNAVIFEEEFCNIASYFDNADNMGNGNGGGGNLASRSGGASGGGGGPSAPAVSNLPGETKPKVDPKAMMACFGNVPDKGAKMKVTVYVQEPFPGTSFNIGPNSVGHTAIGLIKTNGKTSVTQVVGFYPDAAGFSKMHAPGKLVDNTALDYDVSISYTVDASAFAKIVDYVSEPPTTYDLVQLNCTGFVYLACQAGGILVPDPFNNVGINTAGQVMTPAGIGNSIEAMKGKSNVNTSGGTTPASKGPCK